MQLHVQPLKQSHVSALTEFARWRFTCLSGVIWVCLFPLAAVVGLLYPCLDSHLGEPHKFKREWASVMRCIAVFVGINHASVVSFQTSSKRLLKIYIFLHPKKPDALVQPFR